MKKRLQFFIALVLICVMVFGVSSTPASSYVNDVETSTNDMLLVDLDTHTTVFSQKPDNMWYQGNLSELMTFLVAYENIKTPEETEFKVEQSFIDELPYSDGCLKPYIGLTLTAEDLMAVMLLTSGSDAAYALADIVSSGDYDAFTVMMEDKAKDLGCKNTTYLSPGYSSGDHHHTTCRDLMLIYVEARKNEFFNQVMEDREYTPKGLKDEKYTVKTEASILSDNSPYYFKYCNDAKFSYTKATNACIALTTTYRGQTYFFAGLFGLNESEKNVYSDAKKLTTWAYLNLSDRRILDTDQTLASVNINTGWGEYKMDLFSNTSAYKTLPNSFDELLLSYDIKSPDTVDWPLFKGQVIGTAKVSYDSEEIDVVELVPESDEGVDLLSDTTRFGRYIFDSLLPELKKEESADGESEGSKAP